MRRSLVALLVLFAACHGGEAKSVKVAPCVDAANPQQLVADDRGIVADPIAALGTSAATLGKDPKAKAKANDLATGLASLSQSIHRGLALAAISTELDRLGKAASALADGASLEQGIVAVKNTVDAAKPSAAEVTISAGGFSTTNGLRTSDFAIHPGDIVKFTLDQDQKVSPGHADPDKTTAAPALTTTASKCFQFASTGEYGFHSASYDGTVFVRSSIAEFILGLVDSAAIKWLFLILVMVMPLASLLTWAERRQSAMMQDRLGPNRANIGPIKLKGILHFIADALKMIFKEDFIPANVHKGLFALAPLIAIAPVLIAFCIIPFGPTIYPYAVTHVLGSSPSAAEIADPIRMQIFSTDFGLIFYFAVLTLANYGGTIAGWASYNKWALLGGLRSSSQMMSYEVSMGLSLVGAFLICGTLEPGAIVLHGASETMSPANPANWLWLWQPVGLVLFFTAAIAETKRAPFDIPEGEPEIIGYFVEYSGMRWGIFFLAEFIEVVFIAAVVATVFFGGWQVPFLEPDGFHAFGGMLQLPHGIVALLQIAAFGGKLVLLCWFQLMVRWTLPRFRADQLMNLGWKVLLPTSLVWIMFTALLKLVFMA